MTASIGNATGKPGLSANRCIRKSSVNLAVGQERGCVRSTSRSRFGMWVSHRKGVAPYY